MRARKVFRHANYAGRIAGSLSHETIERLPRADRRGIALYFRTEMEPSPAINITFVGVLPERIDGSGALEDLVVILVVEDDQLVQSVVEEALTDGGFEVVIAASGESAVKLLDAANAKYRALVTDINLGRDKMNGWDAARRAREIDPEFPVIYLTGDSADDWASKGVPKSILLSKPFAPAQLVTAVSQLLNTGTAT
jgi:CheY-like chemotaxis protein